MGLWIVVRPSSDSMVSMKTGCSQDSLAPGLLGKPMHTDPIKVWFTVLEPEGCLGHSSYALLPHVVFTLTLPRNACLPKCLLMPFSQN